MRRAAERRTVAGRRRARAAAVARQAARAARRSRSPRPHRRCHRRPSPHRRPPRCSMAPLPGEPASAAAHEGVATTCVCRFRHSALTATNHAPQQQMCAQACCRGHACWCAMGANIQCLLNMLSSDIRCHAVILTAPLRGHGWRTLRRTCAAGAAGGGTSSALGLGAGASSSLSLSLDGIMPAVDDWPPARSGPTM